jgi:hypothetical protein
MSSDELLQALQEDINDLVITQKIDEDIAESHMDVAEELHERVGKRWADNNESN